VTTIDKTDLEAKLREIEGVVVDAEDEAKGTLTWVAVGAVVVVVGIVAIGIWRSRRRKIRVEVYRL
jgi:uncharacterized membrane protein